MDNLSPYTSYQEKANKSEGFNNRANTKTYIKPIDKS